MEHEGFWGKEGYATDKDEPVTIGKFVEKMNKVNKDYFDLVQMLRLKNNMNEIKENLGDEPDK